MSSEKINTAALTQYINAVKAAEMAGKREVKLEIAMAKNIAYTIALAMTKLAGDYEALLSQKSSETDVIQVNLDGGSNW